MDLNNFKGMVRNLTQSGEERAVARALQHYAKGQLDRAVAVLKEAQAKSPEDPAVLFELGRMQTLAQHPLEGSDAFRSILRRDPHALQKVNEAIEELKARHAPGGVLYDAVAEHYLRHDNVPQALMALERMKADELRVVLPRYAAKWEQARKSAPNAKLTRTALLPAYHLALLHETMREHDRAVAIYRDLHRTNQDEIPRILPRLEALAARDYQNAELRLEVAAMLLGAGRKDDAVRQFTLALETNPRAGSAVADRIAERLRTDGDHPELRWILVMALLRTAQEAAAIEAMRPLVQAGAHLDDVIGALQPLAAREQGVPARHLLAGAFARRGQPHQALGPLLQIAEEAGLRSISEALQSLAAAHPDIARLQQLLADVHLEEGRAAEAIAALGRARELAPKEAATLIPRLTRALEIDVTSGPAHLMLADLHQQGGDPERAVLLLRHLVRADPSSAATALERLTVAAAEGAVPRANIGAAEACLALDRFPAALAHLEVLAASHAAMSAEFLHPLGELIARAPDLAPRVILLLEGLEARSPLPVAVHFARGEALYQAGQLAAAAVSFREVLQSAPERVAEVRAALERFDRALPAAAEARYLLATIYLDQRDHDAALRELMRPGPTNATLLTRVLRKYEEILATAPQDLAARAGLLQALFAARQFDRVIEIGRDTLKIRDDQTTARVSLTMADALSEKGDSDGAVRRYFTAYRRDPGLAAETIDRLRRFLDLEGKHPFACLVLGKILAQEARSAEAVEILHAACEADPQLRDAVILELEGLLRTCPADARPGLELIALLLASGQTARAVQTISMQLDSHPDSAQRLATHLDEILQAEPTHPLAQYEQGRALQKLAAHGRSAERYRSAARLDQALATMALRRLQEILIADPACTAACLASADIQASRGHPLQAAKRLAEAIARAPREAGSLLTRLEELYQEHRSQGEMALLFAEACLQSGQHDRAARAYGDAAGIDPAHCEPALMGLDAIISANPHLADGYLIRARTRLRAARGEAALADFAETARLAPRLMPAVIKDVEALSQERGDWAACTLLLADLLTAADRPADAERLLTRKIADTQKGEPRLRMLLRLARCASQRQDEAAARKHLEEAASMSTDRAAFLASVHELQLGMLRRRVALLSARVESGPPRAEDLNALVLASLDLGDLDGAARRLETHGKGCLDLSAARRLQAAIALRRGDFPRASDLLRGLGPSPLLAYGALRAGEYALAVETLEGLLARDADPRTRRLLERTYRDMVAADLLGGSRRLQAETSLTFGEGAAA